ncbi:MAG: zf-HC2 domain-containing protein [Ignavibacteria bacterium]|nr:zf-HC2 domain-containing protein [Ignavibacteria bacterium]
MKHLNEYELWNYLEDKLSNEELENIRQHLSDCEACTHMLKLNGAVLREMMESKSPQLTSNFTHRVLAELNLLHKKRRVFSFVNFPFILFTVFSIFTLSTIIIYYLQSPQNLSGTYSFDVFLKEIINTWETSVKNSMVIVKFLSDPTYLYLFGSIILLGILEFILSRISYKRD